MREGSALSSFNLFQSHTTSQTPIGMTASYHACLPRERRTTRAAISLQQRPPFAQYRGAEGLSNLTIRSGHSSGIHREDEVSPAGGRMWSGRRIAEACL
jgi:hypothetical protein